MSKQLTPRLNRLESNIVIDGGMEIWPEGTSRSVANNSTAYGSVLFKAMNSSTGITLTNSRQSSIPSNASLLFSNQLSKTAAGTLSAGTLARLEYTIEGYDLQKLMLKEWSLIFWVKSSVASNRSIALRNATESHSYVKQYSINQANTWELKALSFPALSSSPATLDRTNGVGLFCTFTAIAGTSLQTASINQWVSGAFAAGIGEDTTWLTGTTHDFNIAGVMIVPGDWTSLEMNTSFYTFLRAGKNFQDELAMSQRYYEKTYFVNDVPGTAVGNGRGELTARWPIAPSSDNELILPWHFKVTKRAIPTIVWYNPTTGAAGTMRSDIPANVSVITHAGNTSEHWTAATNNGATSTAFHRVHGTADARF